MVEVVVTVVVVFIVVVVHFVENDCEVAELLASTRSRPKLIFPRSSITELVLLVNSICELFLFISITKLASRPVELLSKKFIKFPSVLFAPTVKYAVERGD